MITKEARWYIDNVLEREIEKRIDAKFTGNNEFKVNWKNGSISHINIALNKSIKMPT